MTTTPTPDPRTTRLALECPEPTGPIGSCPSRWPIRPSAASTTTSTCSPTASPIASQACDTKRSEASYSAWLDVRGLLSATAPADVHRLPEGIRRSSGLALSPSADLCAGGAGHVRLDFATAFEMLADAAGRRSTDAHRHDEPSATWGLSSPNSRHEPTRRRRWSG